MARIRLNPSSARSKTFAAVTSIRSDDDEEYLLDTPGFASIVVIEEDQPEPHNTGLLDSYGQPIYRIPVDKPPIGFITPPEFAQLYTLDPQEDFYYSTDEHDASAEQPET